MKFLEFEFNDFAIINNVLEREIERVKLCAIVDGFKESKKIVEKLENVKEKIQKALNEELKDFKEYEGRNMHFTEQIKLLKELHKEANIQGALMSAGDIERGLLHLIKENKNLCKDKVEEYLKNWERE